MLISTVKRIKASAKAGIGVENRSLFILGENADSRRFGRRKILIRIVIKNLTGGEFGLGSFENERSFDVLTLPSGNTIDGSYSANLIWFTPSLYLHHEFTPQTVGFFGGGAGIYSISLNEEFDGYSDDIDDDTAFGGFLSLGIDFRFSEAPVAIRLESQTHFVELDAFESTLPGDPTVDGPVHFFMIGVVFQPE